MSTFCGCIPIQSKKKKNKDCLNYAKLELADKEGQKWISSNRSLHDNIPVQLSPEGVEGWRLERPNDKLSWSFYIMSENNKKMYVTFNESNNDVTLEYDDDIADDNGKGRYFSMLLQPKRGLFLRAENTTNRYLYNNGGKLEMVTTESPTSAIHWFLSPSFELIDSIIDQFTVQVHQLNSSQKWLCDGATANAQIQVQQLSSDQDWTLSTTDDRKVQFAVGSLNADDTLQFGTVPANFTLNPYGGGVSLQSTTNSKYVVAPEGNGDLLFSATEGTSTSWDIEIMRLMYECEGEKIIFPEFPIKKNKDPK
uniref:uncharacterized protein LOC120336529 n=1 Tax=Styela clava TaxID=7725 RepID=UPI00193AB50A|nr:uncharacterized protein LOC120336529 [Styela clava]